MRNRQRPARSGAGLLAALATAGVFGAVDPVAAEGKLAQRPAIVGSSVMRWLAPAPKRLSAKNRQQRKIEAARLDSRHGSGTYICSPSGFGKRPRCFAR